MYNLHALGNPHYSCASQLMCFFIFFLFELFSAMRFATRGTWQLRVRCEHNLYGGQFLGADDKHTAGARRGARHQSSSSHTHSIRAVASTLVDGFGWCANTHAAFLHRVRGGGHLANGAREPWVHGGPSQGGVANVLSQSV